MSDLKFSGFGGPSLPNESGEVISVLESGSSYREGSPHSSMLQEAKEAVAGVKQYIREYCRPKLGNQKAYGYSPSKSKEHTPSVSNEY